MKTLYKIQTRILILILAFSSLLFNACSSDNGNDPPNEQSNQDTNQDDDDSDSQDEEDNMLNINIQQLGNDIEGEIGFNGFGARIAINADGTRVITGSPSDDQNGNLAGKVSVYEIVGNTWMKIGNDILGEMEDDNTGIGVSINDEGNVIAFSGFGLNGNIGVGHARVYEFDGVDWQQKGMDIIPPLGSDEQFGSSISMDGIGNRIIVGVPTIDIDGVNRGGARVFEYNSQINDWEQVGNIVELTSICQSCTLAGALRGVSMSSDGMTVSLSNVGSQIPNGPKFVLAFKYDGTSWNPIDCNTESPTIICNIGRSLIRGVLSDDGSRMIIGDPSGISNIPGSVYLLNVNANEMTRIAEARGQINGNFFGSSIGINNDGKRFIVYEAYNLESSDINSGKIYVYYEIDGQLILANDPIEAPSIIDNPTTSNVRNTQVVMSSSGNHFAIGSSNTPANGNRGVIRVYEIIE